MRARYDTLPVLHFVMALGSHASARKRHVHLAELLGQLLGVARFSRRPVSMLSSPPRSTSVRWTAGATALACQSHR